MRRRLRAVDHALGRRRRVDDVVRPAEVFGDQLALGQQQRLDQVRGEEAVLGDEAGVERQFGDLVRDQVQVGTPPARSCAMTWKKPVSSTQW